MAEKKQTMDSIDKIKVEIFDILRQQSQIQNQIQPLNAKIQELEEEKAKKLQELEAEETKGKK